MDPLNKPFNSINPVSNVPSSLPSNTPNNSFFTSGPAKGAPSGGFNGFIVKWLLALLRNPITWTVGGVAIVVAVIGAAFYFMTPQTPGSSTETATTSNGGKTSINGGTSTNGGSSSTDSTTGDTSSTGGAAGSTGKSGSTSTGGTSSGSTGGSTGGGTGSGDTGGGDSGGDSGGGTPPGTCPALPAFPDASCTGWQHTGVTLTTVTPSTPISTGYYDTDGNMNITQAGTTIDSIRFDGCIFVKANNVTIKRSLLTRGWCAEGTISAQLGNYTGIVIEDVEIDGQNQDNTYSGVTGNNFSCLRCNIHNVGTPIRVATNVTVTDSYLHDNAFGGSSHNTGMSMHEGGNVLIKHNNIRCDAGANCSGALELNSRDSYVNTGSVIDNVTLQDNVFYTASGYCMYAGWDSYNGTPTHATNIKVLNNAFKYVTSTCGDLGVVANWADTPTLAAGAGNVWTGNYVFPTTSNLISPY